MGHQHLFAGGNCLVGEEICPVDCVGACRGLLTFQRWNLNARRYALTVEIAALVCLLPTAYWLMPTAFCPAPGLAHVGCEARLEYLRAIHRGGALFVGNCGGRHEV